MNDSAASSNSQPRTKLRRLRQILKWGAWALLACVSGYSGLVLIGLIPVNNDFHPAETGIQIYIISNPVHADVVMPLVHDAKNWREQFPLSHFSGNTSSATHVAVGWGDQGFFIDTPAWADLRVSTALAALFWPTSSCMHVTCLTEDALPGDVKSVMLTPTQYSRLVHYITESFRHDESGAMQQIDQAAYGSYDAFFEARGTYNCFNTCNNWLGRALRAAGVQVGWFTPLPETPLLYIPDDHDK